MELIRIFKNKKFIAAVITLLLLNCVSFYITQQKSLSDFGINIDTYSATFKDNADIFTEVDKKSIIEKSNKFEILKSFADNSEDKAQQIKEYPDLYQEYKNSNYSYEELAAQAEFYSHFAYQLEYQNDYPAYIKSILKNAQNL